MKTNTDHFSSPDEGKTCSSQSPLFLTFRHKQSCIWHPSLKGLSSPRAEGSIKGIPVNSPLKIRLFGRREAVYALSNSLAKQTNKKNHAHTAHLKETGIHHDLSHYLAASTAQLPFMWEILSAGIRVKGSKEFCIRSLDLVTLWFMSH